MNTGRFTFDSTAYSPDWAKRCCLCDEPFVDGDAMDAVAMIPDNDKDLNKMLDGKPYNAPAMLAHTICTLARKGDA